MKFIKTFIGRFQPFHNGHLKVLRAAIDTSDLVVVVIGSASNLGSPGPTFKNPWTQYERRAMIQYALTAAERAKIEITYMPDMPGKDNKWVKAVKGEVRYFAQERWPKEKYRYSIIGCHKGAETYYLQLYRPWHLELIPQNEAMNATDVRSAYFASTAYTAWAENLPGSSASYLYAWKMLNTDAFLKVQQEYHATPR